MEKQKLNLHAHSKFSDGADTILEMAAAYKDAGFTCAVITDHYYGRADLEHYSMTKPKFKRAVRDAERAEKILNFPVIVGVEYGFFSCEEVLCFGREFIQQLYEGVENVEEFVALRKSLPSACILAHPGLSPSDRGFLQKGGERAIDGYESHNSGADMFGWREIPKSFENLTAFSNSDAHQTDSLLRGYNLIDFKIRTEDDLIRYIKEKRPVETYVQHRGEKE